MISNIQNLKKAREMRLSGKSLSEIRREVNVSIGTLSNWLKDMVLNDNQKAELKNRISSRISRGRMNALISIKSSRVYREKSIYEEAKREFDLLANDSFFILGLSLYWASGSKKGSHFQFSSSDQYMNALIIAWCEKYLKIDNSLIKIKKYNGYSRIIITRIDVLRKVIAWQKLLIKYYANMSSV